MFHFALIFARRLRRSAVDSGQTRQTGGSRKAHGARRAGKGLEKRYAFLAVCNKSKLLALVIAVFCAAAIFNFELESGSEAE